MFQLAGGELSREDRSLPNGLSQDPGRRRVPVQVAGSYFFVSFLRVSVCLSVTRALSVNESSWGMVVRIDLALTPTLK